MLGKNALGQYALGEVVVSGTGETTEGSGYGYSISKSTAAGESVLAVSGAGYAYSISSDQASGSPEIAGAGYSSSISQETTIAYTDVFASAQDGARYSQEAEALSVVLGAGANYVLSFGYGESVEAEAFGESSAFALSSSVGIVFVIGTGMSMVSGYSFSNGYVPSSGAVTFGPRVQSG